ncbi:MAG: tRNA lysidine(34) synthetase TilS [Phaeospirillum sp.]|nr:tRNA lysidine(34) synthetase TilS [Phaeospirillum sp.]
MTDGVERDALAPITSGNFAALMDRLGPFEVRPRLAVAVSGGADSLALALLAAGWAMARGGEAVAVTVDHRLRPESAEEASRVAGWLAGRHIRHTILTWDGDKPAADLQAAARDARHGLLAEFCRASGILHLLLAHHREDQAETLLLRLGRGSGIDGLAAMAPSRPTRWGRLLRPLLDVPRARLRATLEAAGQPWIEDMSNANSAFARVRLRRLAPALAAEGLGTGRLAATARRLARGRDALEQAVAEAACRFVNLHPAGFARCDAGAFARLPEEVALRLLSRLLLVVGGGGYSPRLERLERLHAELRAGLPGARTLGGCRLAPSGGEVVVCREPVKVAGPIALVAGEVAVWDGRFRFAVAHDAPPGLTLGALGGVGWRKLREMAGSNRLIQLPACVRPTIPALYGEDGVSAVPHLGYNRDEAMAALRFIEAAPSWTLTATGSCLVSA